MSTVDKKAARETCDIDSSNRTDLFLGKPENEKALVSTVPLGRGSKPTDVANACCFLATEESNFLSGIEVPVDGGRCI